MDFLFQTPTPDLELSIKYFRKLGFEILQKEEYTIAYDQQLKILIDPNRKARAGVCMVKENWDKEVAALQKITKVVRKGNAHFFVGPSGCWFRLKVGAQEKMPSTDAQCGLGKFAGLNLETIDIERSGQLLSCMGFAPNMGSIDQGWLSYTDEEQNTISLMAPFACPHMFFNPSIAFFNGAQNLGIIQGLRDLSVPITEEISTFNAAGVVDNIIVREPGGYGFFIFSD